MTFYSENTKKGIIMTQEDEEDYRNIKICRFCEKEMFVGKLRDHCFSTG